MTRPPAPIHARRWHTQATAMARRVDWTQQQFRRATACLPAVALALVWAAWRHDPEGGVMAVGGAVAVGFGAFLRFGRDRELPLGLTISWMALCTFVGSVSHGGGRVVEVAVAMVWGWGFGLVASLGWGAWWVGLQGMIALFAFGSIPAGPAGAARFAGMVMAGGTVQLIAVLALRAGGFRPNNPPGRPVPREFWPAFVHAFTLRTAAGRHALRTALVLGTASLISSFGGLPHGYWVPMTASILLKPDLHETAARGLMRLCGTLVGAGVVTLLTAWLRPTPLWLDLGLLVAVWGSFSLQRVNYAIYAMCVTAYVVFTLSAIGLPERSLAGWRVVATLIGAALALAAHALPLTARRRHRAT